MRKPFFTTLCADGLVLVSASFNNNQVKAENFVYELSDHIEWLGSDFSIGATYLEDRGDKMQYLGSQISSAAS